MNSKQKALSFVLACWAGVAHGQLDERIWMGATINGKHARLIFDTGSTLPMLLPKGAARLGLSITNPPKDVVPERGGLIVGQTEGFDLMIGGIKHRTSFAVINVPNMLNFDADGIIGWMPIRQNIVSINALSGTAEFLSSLPKEAAKWTKLKLQTNSSIVRLEWTSQDGTVSSIVVDTGWPQGITVAPERWRSWKASHPNQPKTLLAYYEPTPGLVVAEEVWAKELSFGPFSITDVPIIEAHKEAVAAVGPSYQATFGLWALKRMEIIIDGMQGAAYVRPRKTRPPLYSHNRLGAVFVPRDLQAGEDLIGQVVPGSPASEAGIRAGDVLLKIGELDVTKWRTDPAVLPLSRFWNRATGEKLDLALKRGTERFKVSVVLREILSPETASAAKALRD